VTVYVDPASCGPVTFDGGDYASGTPWTGAPGPTALAASVPSCAAGAFVGWNATGGVSLASQSGPSASVVVSASGDLSAIFQ